jgi:hypothetical protein
MWSFEIQHATMFAEGVSFLFNHNRCNDVSSVIVLFFCQCIACGNILVDNLFVG